MDKTCGTCRWLKTFIPRPDEQKRYGFGDFGYGCNKPGWEGYTKREATCPAHVFARTPKDQLHD